MTRKARSVLLACLPLLALGACADSERERELALQLEQARTEARLAAETADRAKREAARAQAANNNASLADFYGGVSDADGPSDPSPENADTTETDDIGAPARPNVDIQGSDVGIVSEPSDEQPPLPEA